MVAFSVNKMGNCDNPKELHSIAVWVTHFMFHSTVLSSRIICTFGLQSRKCLIPVVCVKIGKGV